MSSGYRRLSRHALTLLALGVGTSAQGQGLSSQSNWGGVGLLQTPSARMAEEGEFAFTASHTSPYDRYNVSMQPFPWLEGTFRYVNIVGLRYGLPELSGDQNLKDKSIDVKLRLWQESRRLPEVALGLRDVGGTGLFSGEYLVASKRFGAVDTSLGLATGYLGNRGDIGNPLGALNERYKTRPGGHEGAGRFSTRNIFRGRVGVFGGIAWQTPWERLLLKLEYDGNDYRDEPRDLEIEARSPINVGAVFTAHPNVQLSLGWERGNELMAGLTLRTNLARGGATPKPLDPPPPPLRPRAEIAATAANIAPAGPYRDAAEQANAEREDRLRALAGIDWEGVAEQLRGNAGLDVERISTRGGELIVHGRQTRYFYPAQGVGRTARILDAAAPAGFDWFTVGHTRAGMEIAETSVHRDSFADYVDHRTDLQALARNTEFAAPAAQRRDVLYEAPLERYAGGLSLGYGQILGGPDGFILYQFSAHYAASWRFRRNLWLDGVASYNLLDNYHRFRYDAPSRLPRVRTDMRRYVTTSDFTVPNLQLTATGQLSRDVYGMAYAGMLETMYGGIGGELLYRPLGQRWAIGVDANWVRQRAFEQDLRFRDYEIATGHASLYYQLGERQRVLATISAGRYLAGDWGATFNLSRVFDNGATMGAWATRTNVSSADFGEGSFDKGIYLSVPFDFMLPRSSRSRANLVWQPLTRDGGAALGRRYALYGLTGERDGDFLHNNFEHIGR